MCLCTIIKVIFYSWARPAPGVGVGLGGTGGDVRPGRLLQFQCYSRHDGRDGKQLGHQIRQVAEREYEEGLDLWDLGGEPRREGGHKAEQDAEARPAEPHHKEPGHAHDHIHRIHHWHMCQKAEHVVQHLGTETTFSFKYANIETHTKSWVRGLNRGL